MAIIQNACIFGFAGLTQPSQWQAANALYVTGNIGQSSLLLMDNVLITARNLLQVFYHAAFPAMVRDLPKMIESEKQVLRGEKTYVPLHTELTLARKPTQWMIC
jgi:hypothetical protein